MLSWTDRVYGPVTIDDPRVEALVHTPTMRRLAGIRQSGPSALVFPFKSVDRLEHSLGVYHLLTMLGASHKECVAGLLHDISHTAFSHAIDFLITSDEQNHHERLKDVFLHRPDIVEALAAMGYAPADFEDDAIYPLLERPLPELCADRIDYFLRDGLACGEIGQPFVSAVLRSLAVVNERIAVADAALARTMAEAFARMNDHWWASESESFIYNRFADLLRRSIDAGAIREDDLLGSDDEVIALIERSGDESLRDSLHAIRNFCPSDLADFRPMVIPKHRWIDPPVWTGGRVELMSKMAWSLGINRY
jgi:HD superfamily phosphohydrolase